MTKVKGFGYHHGQVMDVADYVVPSQVCVWLITLAEISDQVMSPFELITR